MTEEELQESFRDFNARYFGNALKCELVVTENWIDDAGNYYPDSAVKPETFGLGIVGATKVRHATPTYTQAEDRIRIPRALIAGEKSTMGVLLP